MCNTAMLMLANQQWPDPISATPRVRSHSRNCGHYVWLADCRFGWNSVNCSSSITTLWRAVAVMGEGTGGVSMVTSDTICMAIWGCWDGQPFKYGEYLIGSVCHWEEWWLRLMYGDDTFLYSKCLFARPPRTCVIYNLLFRGHQVADAIRNA